MSRRTVVSLVILVAFCLLFGVVAIPFGVTPPFQASVVPSASMTPALLPGDYMVVSRWGAAQRPARGNVVAFRYPRDEGVQFVKRVVGLPGDRIVLRGRAVYVNCGPGDTGCPPLDEPYTFYDNRLPDAPDFEAVTVPPAAVFVMADNRNAGEDSRDFGAVTHASIVGRPLVVYWSMEPANDEKGFWQRVRWNRFGHVVR